MNKNIKLKRGQDNIVAKGLNNTIYTLRKVEDGTYRAYWDNFTGVNNEIKYTIEDIEDLINGSWKLISAEIEEDVKDKFEELKELSEPIIEYLNNNYEPHAWIVIREGRIDVVSEEISIPLEGRD